MEKKKIVNAFMFHIVNVYETMLLLGPLMSYDMHTYILK